MTAPPLELVVLNDYASPTGGSTAVALAAATELAARGVPVTWFSCVGPVAPRLRDDPGIAVVCLDQPDIGRNPRRGRAFVDGWRNARAVRSLQAVLACKSPASTVVHAHTWSQALSPFVLAAVRQRGFRLVLTLHDYFAACPNGQFFVYPAQQVCERRPLSAACWRCNCDRRNFGHKLWRNARAAIQHRLLRASARPSCFIGVSAFSLNRLRPHLPPAVPTRVIRNPVACVRDEPAPVAANREFLFIGRFEAEKGALLFARAVRAAGVPAAFVGDGSLRAELLALCPHARFTGWLAPAETRRELRRARALVFPSLWAETFGLAAAEAVAAGVPVIVSDHCAVIDFVAHRVNGLHFAHGSAPALAAQLQALAGDAPLAAQLGRTGYDTYWRDPWTVGRHVDRLLAVYHEVLGGDRRNHPGESIHESLAGVGTGS
jgi:glycosyltransferase involved in cell wall biosynthesis